MKFIISKDIKIHKRTQPPILSYMYSPIRGPGELLIEKNRQIKILNHCQKNIKSFSRYLETVDSLFL